MKQDLPNLDGYGPAAIEVASGGYITKRIRQNMDDRGQWAMGTPQTKRGRSRSYTLAHCYQAAIVGDLASRGFTLDRVNNAIKARMVVHARSQGNGGSWAGAALRAFANLPEFRADDAYWFWIIVPSYQHGTSRQDGVDGTLAVQGDEAIKTALSGAPLALVLPISKVVRRVHQILQEQTDATEKTETLNG